MVYNKESLHCSSELNDSNHWNKCFLTIINGHSDASWKYTYSYYNCGLIQYKNFNEK